MNYSSQMQLFELKLFLPIGHNSAAPRKEIAYHEYRQNCFLSNHGFRPIVSFPAVRCSLQRKLQGDYVHLSGSVPLHGLRSTYLSRKPQGHRSMSSCSKIKTVPYGNQRKHFTKHSGPCKREPRLANLCRLRTRADQNRQGVVRKRRLWPGVEEYRLRFRLNNHRPLSFSISLGQLPQNQSCGEASYAIGSPGQYPRCDQHYQRENQRCQRARRSHLRGGGDLYLRPGLHRFCPTLSDSSISCVLRNSREEQFRFQAPLLSSGGQIDRCTVRPDHYGLGLLYVDRLPREAQAHPLLRRRYQEAVCLFDEQLRATGNRDREALQMSLAGGAVLQMDQAAPADQSVLWHQRERAEDSNMDRHLCVCSRSHCQEKIKAGSEPLHNSTDFECDPVRENAHFAGSFFTELRK